MVSGNRLVFRAVWAQSLDWYVLCPFISLVLVSGTAYCPSQSTPRLLNSQTTTRNHILSISNPEYSIGSDISDKGLDIDKNKQISEEPPPVQSIYSQKHDAGHAAPGNR